MRRTPDPRTAKRERLIEEETPNNRQRTSSVELEPGALFGTPVGTPSVSSQSHKSRTLEEDCDKMLDWNKSIEDEERDSNVSKVIQMFESADNDSRTDGMENIDDSMLNKMIEDNLNQRQDNGVPGVLPLEPTADKNRSQDNFSNLLQLIIKKAINEAVKPLKDEIMNLKYLVQKNSYNNNRTDNLMEQAPTRPIWPKIISPPTLPHIPKASERDLAFNLARRSLGLFPISQDDLIRNTDKVEDCSDRILREQIGGANTVRDYLSVVLGMEEDEARSLNIIKVFKQTGNNNTNVLFVEFTNENDVKKIKKLVGKMEAGGEPQLLNFIPKLLQTEYDIVSQRAFKGRNQINKHSSKIWITTKFELRLRPKGDYTPWNKIQQEDPDKEPMKTGTIPKTTNETPSTTTAPTATATYPPKHKPDFSNTNNPNFQVVGSRSKKAPEWEGLNLLPQQIPTINGFQNLGEELSIRP